MMRFIDDQNRGKPFGAARREEMAEIEQQLALVFSLRRQPEVGKDILQKFGRGKTAIEDIGVSDVLAVFQQSQQAPEQQGLSGAHLARDDDKTLVAADTIVECSQGLVVLSGRNKVGRVRGQIEWIARQ